MEYIFLNDVLKAVDGKLIKEGKIKKFNSVSIDTRKISENGIFIAIKGENYDANEFIPDASKSGAALCIVEKIKYGESDLLDNTSVIIVENTRKALLKLAKYYKSMLGIKVIGITGSTGKTSTKDMTYAILSEKYKVYKTQGNFNNEIGLPLTIFSLDKTYDMAVLEMGMSNFFEIHNMADASRPDIAIMTNIGISHIENLKTRENILKAKLEITDYFKEDNKLIINTDNDLLGSMDKNNRGYNIESCGTSDKNDIKAENIKLFDSYVTFDIVENGKKVCSNFKVLSPGAHSVLNALLAVAAGRTFGLNYDEIKSGILNLEKTSMRLDIVKNNGFTIVNDCYNASPDSMRAAIDVMKNLEGKRRIAVFGTMRELGSESNNAHREVAEYASENGVDFLFALGEYSKDYLNGYKNKDNFKEFNSNIKAAEYLKQFIKNEDIVLIKASRAMKLEEIVKDILEGNN
ncbi:MAG: UDP-N-acetylmuramoyl-tripeptide--D-alanyl-D-alanine ligase [Clostridium sp.]|nr:UDP-N-acetylmuramoyl-tripeptide--D-alanyl-D-alanine ligase [Clostridium sp.]